MHVPSDRIDRPTMRFEAPPAARVRAAMTRFIAWLNATAPGGPLPIPRPPVRAALAHRFFESIHPFEEGTGPIGRALAEKALSQGLGRPVVLGLSRTIDARRNGYHAQREAETGVRFALRKSRFFRQFAGQLNAKSRSCDARSKQVRTL